MHAGDGRPAGPAALPGRPPDLGADAGWLAGRLFTRPTPLKLAHLAASPYVSCSYWDPQHEVAVAECRAEFADDEESRKELWDLFASTPPPLGYDPKILGGEDHRDPKITVLRLTPWRLSAAGEAWRAA
ncbi:pyridoxamine 5'-phosphate oxidase [Amycolatopsis lexingtonensis]|uniref:pyridoxamine 5'-phosphate oxidase n=1 Tax=Amycolatopsis lexingtonensis TaxID=218822 RepID=UPI003F717270